MTWRAVLAFLLLPGIVAYLVPYLMAPAALERASWQWLGALLLAAGSVALLRCAREFRTRGEGTLAPWSPPRRLVTTGLYRRSRNPMYVAVLVVLIGWSVWYRSLALGLYTVAVAGAFHLRVLLYEEPKLEETFGAEWRGYRERVRRWL
ncbi:MAG: isoprenylcysteine carboxylmethyltransferase family protein [Gemmatimonadota bacterium]